jgi:hypothetical protein
MNAGKAVYGILSANSGVTDLVGTRIFPEIAEQEAATPFIIYQLQSVAPEDTHDGPSKLDEVRFEFLCYADTYNEAADLGEKVRAALDRVKGTFNSVNVESVQFNDVDVEIEYQPRRYSQVLKFTFRIKRDDVTIPQGPPAIVTDGDGSTHEVDPGGTYTCIVATTPLGIHYHRVIPWDQNDPSLTAYVAYQKTQGTYDYTPPSNPETIAMLANGYVGTDSGARLAENNKFGNTFRFTNDEGEQYTEGFAESGSNTSSNPRYCIDHFTGLGWYVQDAYNDRVQRTPSEASTYVSSFTYAGFSDWRLADASEYIVAAHYADFVNSYTGVYAPFVDELTRLYGGQFWYGTYTKDNNYLQLRTNGGTFQERNATHTSGHLLMVRNQYI